MYSIILKLKSNCDCGCGCKIDNTKPSSPKERWKYLTNADGSIYQEEDLEKVRLKCIELLSDNLLSSIKVVQNKAATAYVQIEGAPDPHVSVLPTVTDADNGKVLMVIEGEWGVSEIEVLPNVTLSDDGKILKVVNGEWTVADEVVNTDSKVTQTNVTTNGEYRVLLSKQTDNEEHTDTVLKSGQLIYNPYENHINVIKNTENLYTESNMSDDSLGVFNWDKTNNIRKSLRVEYDDITLSNQTWDGTNTSLKHAIAAATTSADENVKQIVTTNGVYDLLLSESVAGSATATEQTRKSGQYALKYSTHGNILMVGDDNTEFGGVTIGGAGFPSIDIGSTDSQDRKTFMNINTRDIVFGANPAGTPKTWDGVNTSLKSALASLAKIPIIGTVVSTNDAIEDGANLLPPNKTCIAINRNSFDEFLNQSCLNIVVVEPSELDPTQYSFTSWQLDQGNNSNNVVFNNIYSPAATPDTKYLRTISFSNIAGYISTDGNTLYSNSINGYELTLTVITAQQVNDMWDSVFNG